MISSAALRAGNAWLTKLTTHHGFSIPTQKTKNQKMNATKTHGRNTRGIPRASGSSAARPINKVAKIFANFQSWRLAVACLLI